jgi:hypothetical protein
LVRTQIKFLKLADRWPFTDHAEFQRPGQNSPFKRIELAPGVMITVV